MMRVTQNIKAKEIKGKRFRSQFILNVVLFILAVSLLFSVYYCAIGKEEIDEVFLVFVLGTPYVLIGVLQKYVFGKLLFIISDDRLYFFDAYVKQKSKTYRGCGYVDFKDITEVEYEPSVPGFTGRQSEVVVHGDEFTIRICRGERAHKRVILKKVHEINSIDQAI